MELTVYNIDGSKTARTVVLNDSIFAIEPNDHAIYLDVKQYMANQRQGTHKTKGRSEVMGSTRKLHRQKGTGGSRKGDIKSPIFRGGGRIFGPEPRDYSFKINKKVKRLARKSALTYKAKDNNIMVLEPFQFEEPKTKNYLEVLKKFNLEGKKSLLVIPEVDRTIVLSSRNIPKAKVALASELNTYMILNADHLLILENSLPEVENILLD
ncbi:MAG: 50S ribosomal protein L4 [Bacteroidales bacterium]|nr:50S ribosomal protein L4 [Bacteroidales bacterium]